MLNSEERLSWMLSVGRWTLDVCYSSDDTGTSTDTCGLCGAILHRTARRAQPASRSRFSPSPSPLPKPPSVLPWSSQFIVTSAPPTSISSINSKDEFLDHE